MPADLQLKVDLSQVFTFFFITLGPLRLLGPFAKVTRGYDEDTVRRFAIIGAIIATIALIVAALLGSVVLQKWHVSIGALSIAGGIVLLCVALPTVLGRPNDGGPPATGAVPEQRPEADASRLVVPAIITPYGVAVLIIFVTLMPERTLPILGLLVLVMVLDLLAMIFARQILRTLGAALRIFGMILGVLQVALAVQIIFYGVRILVETARHG